MAGRREKLRRVGIIPEYCGFTPDGLASGDAINMTVDELEVLRLCDLEGLNQEEVAQHMGIARATVAAICSRAHRKVANALVNGRAIVIEGGNISYSPLSLIHIWCHGPKYRGTWLQTVDQPCSLTLLSVAYKRDSL